MNLQETVLIQLRDLILRGEFEPGQRLAEQQLAERLGASRTPVRAALVTLEQEGLVEANETGKFLVRQFTPREVADAIAVRGHLEGMAARLVAEHGVSRQLQLDLQACLEDGDRALAANPLTYESYADYAAMNDRFHALILQACGNRALQRAVALNDKLPFAPASAMLPMQGTVTLDRDWMLYAHRQHHMLFAALKAGEGARAQALAVEHTEVAQMNLRMALERRAETEQVLPAIRLVVGR
ncbi:MAG: GntR family transcriptional regulator [Polaromonas sp.]|uniref:GntR family transcriptional regulator n=1 Tax=Polaromonas sp. TaxID=1869339 RepID=UPI00271FCAF3|nr:GntR family transcriptional regulator [Polaromonas sp.]MDO9113736.1 GntR family transcriptional regulator [Polaromonas sp.]MDP1884836.1 GntR family transcriptional regulator [Polaromonas sp.]